MEHSKKGLTSCCPMQDHYFLDAFINTLVLFMIANEPVHVLSVY